MPSWNIALWIGFVDPYLADPVWSQQHSNMIASFATLYSVLKVVALFYLCSTLAVINPEPNVSSFQGRYEEVEFLLGFGMEINETGSNLKQLIMD